MAKSFVVSGLQSAFSKGAILAGEAVIEVGAGPCGCGGKNRQLRVGPGSLVMREIRSNVRLMISNA
jgi:hypothetical protein